MTYFVRIKGGRPLNMRTTYLYLFYTMGEGCPSTESANNERGCSRLGKYNGCFTKDCIINLADFLGRFAWYFVISTEMLLHMTVSPNMIHI